MNKTTKHANHGFTLLEVLAAVAILGIAITVVIQLFSGGLRLEKESEDYTRAVFYGRQLLEELSLKKEFTETSEEGVFEGDYRWKYEIEPVAVVEEDQYEKYPLDVLKIKVLVFWPHGDKDKSLSFETIKTFPKTEEESLSDLLEPPDIPEPPDLPPEPED